MSSQIAIAQNDNVNSLTKLQAGIFLDQETVNEIKKQYPGLADILENALHLPAGYHAEKDYMKKHMNKVAQLQADDKRKAEKIKALEEALNSERKQHDEEVRSLNNELRLTELQRDFWKERAQDNLKINFQSKAAYAGGGFALGTILAVYAAVQ